jgi:hypothetical protein
MKYKAEPAGRPSRNGAGRPTGAIRLIADKRDAHETAGGVRLQVKQSANLFGR